MIAMPNAHLVLHKETLNNTLKNKISIKDSSDFINLGAKNCPVGRKGLTTHMAMDRRTWMHMGDALF